MLESISLAALCLSMTFSALPNMNGSEKDHPLYPSTYYSRDKYFRNLYENQSKNLGNTCSFVALSSVLSYADTFYNDTIIPEKYDKTSSKTSLTSSYTCSSGVISSIKSSSESIYSFVKNNFDSDYQSYLIKEYNLLNSSFTEDRFVSSAYPEVAFPSLLSGILPGDLVPEMKTKRNSTQSEYVSFIQRELDYGRPVIVSIYCDGFDLEHTGNHAVVAYKYDDDAIYANYGWGSYSTELPLLSNEYGYNTIYGAISFDFSKIDHIHSNNYVVNNKTNCACNLNEEVVCVEFDPNLVNPPSFAWMRKYPSICQNERFEVEIGYLNGQNLLKLFDYETGYNEISFSYSLWENIRINARNGFYFKLVRIIDGSRYESHITEYRWS